MSKDLLSHSTIQGLSVSSLCHCDVGGVTREPFILIHNIKEAGSVREEIYGKLIINLDVVVRVEE